jgi:sigma-B regulation protein RsbU (phosphoserine phosphatase)
MRILIAEDDATSRIVLATVLTKDGYDVTATDDGGAAWEVLQKPEAPRLAILDLMMPGIDGLELVRRVRAIPSVAPPYLIIVSTKSEKSDVIAALDAGANDYLTKPFDPGELRARIEVGRRMIEMRFELNEKVTQLKQALAEVRTLKGIVPICANCKNVRDDQGYWNRVESYLNEHTEADFTHAVCPDCMKRLYPQFDTDSDVKDVKKR